MNIRFDCLQKTFSLWYCYESSQKNLVVIFILNNVSQVQQQLMTKCGILDSVCCDMNLDSRLIMHTR